MRVEVLLHSRVEAELRQLRKTDSRWQRAVDTAIEKLLSAPHSAGSPLRGIGSKDLQGRILKLHVGGRRGHRLFYWVPHPVAGSEVSIVIPLYLSEERRATLDYDGIDVNTIGADIVDDYRSGRFDQFKRFRDLRMLAAYLD